MAYDKEKLRKQFPHLAAELNEEPMKIPINSVRTEDAINDNTSLSKSTNYSPDIIDFLRRCDKKEEAQEIIDYMEKRGEISNEYAKNLRKQVNEKGVRSFGTKKVEGYYFYYFNERKNRENNNKKITKNR